MKPTTYYRVKFSVNPGVWVAGGIRHDKLVSARKFLKKQKALYPNSEHRIVKVTEEPWIYE